MQTRITLDEMRAASRQLAKSGHGRAAMSRLIDLLKGDALDLDLLDQRAFLALLGGAWTGQAQHACEIMRETLAAAKAANGEGSIRS